MRRLLVLRSCISIATLRARIAQMTLTSTAETRTFLASSASFLRAYTVVVVLLMPVCINIVQIHGCAIVAAWLEWRTRLVWVAKSGLGVMHLTVHVVNKQGSFFSGGKGEWAMKAHLYSDVTAKATTEEMDHLGVWHGRKVYKETMEFGSIFANGFRLM